MKDIHVSFIGLLEGYGSIDELWIYRVMKKHYNVIIEDDLEKADYHICGPFTTYGFCGYDKVRIAFYGENLLPDLNLVDYAITSYPLSLGDRCFRLPVFVDQFGTCQNLKNKDRNYEHDVLEDKKYFANFIAGHESENNIRGDFFKLLCKYKRVESPGSYLNNMPDGFCVKWTDSSKRDFQSKCKFTLCFESTKHYGFITEKLVDAFDADTVPVYFGSDDVTDIFNKDAFIRCNGRDDFENTINRIIELDNDDEKYMKMLRQPIFVDSEYVDKILDKFEKFVVNIFEQPVNQAYRRSRVYSPTNFEKYILEQKRMDLRRAPIKILCGEFFRRIKKKFKK